MDVMLVFAFFLLNLVRSGDSTACGVSFNESSGEVSSPNFPDYFPTSQSPCSWRITVPSGRIKLTFHYFILEPNRETFCTSQSVGARLAITNVDSNDNRTPFELCGQEIPPPVYSVGKFMTLTLTVGAKARPGFNLSYETITDDTLCPSAANLTALSGKITSPYYPRNYPSRDETCHWEIIAPRGKRLKLEVTDMAIERCGQDGSCTCDYLEVLDGFSGTSGSGRGDASGKTCVDSNFQQLIYYSTNERLRVRFATDHGGNKNYKGFSATYTQLDYSPKECPKLPIHLSGNGNLSSPNYPKAKYLSGRNCYWVITAAPGKQVKVIIKDYALGRCDESSCADYCSHVDFHDGSSSAAPYLGRLCTISTPTAKISSGNQMFVHFSSQWSPDRGFLAEYSEVTGDPSPTQTKPPTTPTTTVSTAKPPTTAEYSEVTGDPSPTQTKHPTTPATTVSTAKPPTTGAAALTITLMLVIIPSFAVTFLWP